MIMTKTEALELGYFMDGMDIEPLAAYQALIRTIDDGVILPSRWETVDETGESISLLDTALGGVEYASFVEIPTDAGDLWTDSGYGLGFTQKFLEAQQVTPVEYLILGEDLPRPDPEHVLDGLARLWDFAVLDGQGRVALENLRQDPQKQAALREWVAENANEARTYYEIIHPATLPEDRDAVPREWRATTPVHFSLEDIQTVYLCGIDEVSHFRLMYPGYRGTFVALR